MQIDTFTFIAQIVNFLILVVLLKQFLYGPIVRMMEQREEGIRGEIETAQRRSEEAETARQAYEEERAQLEQQTAAILSRAEEDADRRKAELTVQARQEAERAGIRWRQAVERERSAFVRELRLRSGAQVVEIARRALESLADDDLQARVARVFAQRLRELHEDEATEMAERIAHTGSAQVVSAFELQAGQRELLADLVADRFGEGISVSFETSPDLICGVELRTDGRKVAWSIDSYLTALEDEVLRLMEETSVEMGDAEAPADEPGGES